MNVDQLRRLHMILRKLETLERELKFGEIREGINTAKRELLDVLRKVDP